MHVEIRTKNLRLEGTAREEMTQRVRSALGRFAGRISLVTVGLSDLNGPRRGADKLCRLVVRLIRAGKVTIEEINGNVAAAVGLAADRAGRTVGRELHRRRDFRYGRRSWETRLGEKD